MPCPPQVPISILPPVSQGPSPILWQNGNQITRLNTPLNPSWLVYDGSTTRWGDGSAQAPVYLPNIQEVNGPTVTYVAGITSTGQLVKTIGASGTALVGGVAGSIVYQSAPSVTGFTAAGTTNQVLHSNGASTPTWSKVVPADLSTGGPVWATNGTVAVGKSIALNGSISDYSVLTITNSGINGVQVHLNANGASEGNLRTVTNHPLSFSTNNTQRMVIDTSGNVGIGTNSPTGGGGGTTLNVKGSSAATIRVDNGTAAYDVFVGGTDVYQQNSNATGAMRFRTGSSTTERLSIGADGVIDAKTNPITNCKTTAKAWVNFDGAGTIGQPQTIRSYYNVSSVSKLGNGDYYVNFATNMTNANYTVAGTADVAGSKLALYLDGSGTGGSVSSVRIAIATSGGATTLTNASFVSVQIFGD